MQNDWIIQEHFDGYFMRKNTLPAPGFEPITFLLRTSWLAITFLNGFDSLRLIAWLLLAASTLGDIADITNSLL